MGKPNKETVSLGLETWTGTLGILHAGLEAGTPEGKALAKAELRKMARVADMVPEALESVRDLLWELERIINQGTILPGEPLLAKLKAARAVISKTEGA